MTTFDLINDYNNISVYDMPTIKYQDICDKLRILIGSIVDTPEYYINGGESLLYIVYIEYNFKKKNYLILHIKNLLEIYCKTNNYFLQHLAETLLSDIFTVPYPFYFKSNFIYYIYTYLKSNLNMSKVDDDKHTFYEILSTFFMLHSKKLYLYKKSLPTYKPDEFITKLFSASLVGLAVGDSLGFLVEGQSREICERYVDEVIKTHLFLNYGIHKNFGHNGNPRYVSCDKSDEWAFKLGQYTDDTQLCRELIKSITMNKGEFNSSDFSDRLIMLIGKAGLLRPDTKVPNNNKLYIIDGIVGYGKTTVMTTQCLADGLPWEQTGVLIKSQGNGGCMRVAPLGVLFFEQPWRLREIASLQSLGTHGSSRCRATSVLIAEATRLACESKVYPWSFHIVKNPVIFCNRLKSQLMSVDMELANSVKLIPKWLEELNEQKLVHLITEKGLEMGDSLWDNGNVISASAVQTALFAVVCFLRYPDNYEQAICMAIRGGGDVDTTAAICGGIVAARTGEYLNVQVNDRGNWDIKELDNLANLARNSVL
jgi:ADP-ribosylglycohydrolase